MNTPVSDPAGASDEGLRRLERELKVARRFGERAVREMHAAVAADLTKARQQAKRAEKRAAEAERRARLANRRAKRAERELAALRASSTWRAGRAIVAVPARIKGWTR